MKKEIKEAYEFLTTNGFKNPEVGIILGTGLGALVNEIDIRKNIPYDDIPHFPVATVEFHSGNLIFGTLKNTSVVAMHGRFHYYEGYSYEQITLPIRVMRLLGIKYLLISNAAGAMNLDFKKGSLMLIEDHINLLPANPLIGRNLDEFGTRFPDMSQPYSSFLNRKFENIAKKLDLTLHKGVYVAVPGPMLETRAEYRYLRTIGADIVGMSTVPEVIVANHMNLPVAAISVITDECDPENLKPIDLPDILATAAKSEIGLIQLFSTLIEEL